MVAAASPSSSSRIIALAPQLEQIIHKMLPPGTKQSSEVAKSAATAAIQRLLASMTQGAEPADVDVQMSHTVEVRYNTSAYRYNAVFMPVSAPIYIFCVAWM